MLPGFSQLPGAAGGARASPTCLFWGEGGWEELQRGIGAGEAGKEFLSASEGGLSRAFLVS